MNLLGAHVKGIAGFGPERFLSHHLINSRHCLSKGKLDHLGNFVRVCPQIAHHEVMLLARHEKENNTFMYHQHHLNIYCCHYFFTVFFTPSLKVICEPDTVSFNMNCGDETIGGDIINVNRGLKNIVENIQPDISKKTFFTDL